MINAPISDLISKDLRRWFKEKWVDVSRKDKDGKHPPCGRGEAKTDSKGYPKCRPSKKVSEDTPKTSRSMSRKEKKAATRRKRSKPQGVGGKPTIVKNIFDNISPQQARAMAFSLSSPFDYMDYGEEELPEVMMDNKDDPCCSAAKDKLAQAWADSNNMSSEQHQTLRDHMGEMDCEMFREFMENDNSAQSMISRGNPRGHEVLARDRKILAEWDECASESFSGDFTASADPFEAAWDSISKDFYFDEKGGKQGEGGTFVGPSTYGITQVDDAKGRRTGIKGLFSNRRRDIEAIEEDGNPSSQNTILTDDHINDTKGKRRFDTKPYDSSERKERGEFATQNDAQFRRGASLPRTTQVATDMPYYRAERFIDMKGNEMDSKGEKEGWGTWDRTGKRQFRSDFNNPIHFEGQTRNYATHVGANLSTYGEGLRQGDYDEDEAIQRITRTLGHEYTHSAIDPDLKEAVKRGDLPVEHLHAAHEVGAHIGELAELDDEQMEYSVNRRLERHPNTSSLNLVGHTPEKFRGRDNQIKMPKMLQGSNEIKQASFDQAWSSITKGRFHGYSRSNISDRPYRQAEHRVWDISRKVKRERTKRRYARNKSRGTVRPAMRRQLGAGGKRASTKR